MRFLRGGLRRGREKLRDSLQIYKVDVLRVSHDVEDAERYRQLAGRGTATSIHAGRDEHDPVLREVLPTSQLGLLPERMAREDECHVVLVDGEPVGWLWFARRSHRDPWSGLWIELGPGEIYYYDLWIDPDRRRGGLALAVTKALLLSLSEEPSIHVAYCWVDQRNTPSQRLVRGMLGFTQLGTVRYARVLHRYGVTVPLSKRPRSAPIGGRPWARKRSAARR